MASYKNGTYFEFSPVYSSSKKKEKEELSVLRLMPFVHSPKITFDVVLGKTVEQKLRILNPKDVEQEVFCDKLPSKESRILCSMSYCILAPAESVTITLSWTPTEIGNVREVIYWRTNIGVRSQTIIIGTCTAPKLKKKTRNFNYGTSSASGTRSKSLVNQRSAKEDSNFEMKPNIIDKEESFIRSIEVNEEKSHKQPVDSYLVIDENKENDKLYECINDTYTMKSEIICKPYVIDNSCNSICENEKNNMYFKQINNEHFTEIIKGRFPLCDVEGSPLRRQTYVKSELNECTSYFNCKTFETTYGSSDLQSSYNYENCKYSCKNLLEKLDSNLFLEGLKEESFLDIQCSEGNYVLYEDNSFNKSHKNSSDIQGKQNSCNFQDADQSKTLLFSEQMQLQENSEYGSIKENTDSDPNLENSVVEANIVPLNRLNDECNFQAFPNDRKLLQSLNAKSKEAATMCVDDLKEIICFSSTEVAKNLQGNSICNNAFTKHANCCDTEIACSPGKDFVNDIFLPEKELQISVADISLNDNCQLAYNENLSAACFAHVEAIKAEESIKEDILLNISPISESRAGLKFHNEWNEDFVDSCSVELESVMHEPLINEKLCSNSFENKALPVNDHNYCASNEVNCCDSNLICEQYLPTGEAQNISELSIKSINIEVFEHSEILDMVNPDCIINSKGNNNTFDTDSCLSRELDGSIDTVVHPSECSEVFSESFSQSDKKNEIIPKDMVSVNSVDSYISQSYVSNKNEFYISKKQIHENTLLKDNNSNVNLPSLEICQKEINAFESDKRKTKHKSAVLGSKISPKKNFPKVQTLVYNRKVPASKCTPFRKSKKFTTVSRSFYDGKSEEKQARGFCRWFNFVISNFSCNVFFHDYGKIDNPENKINESLGQVTTDKNLHYKACEMFLQSNVSEVIKNIEVAIDKKYIILRDDKNLCKNIGLKQHFLDYFLCYNVRWLRIGLEAVYGYMIPYDKKHPATEVIKFLKSRFFSCPFLESKFAHPSVPNSFKEGFEVALKSFQLKRFFSLVYFLDYAKCFHLLNDDPCLFKKNATYKSSKDILSAFSRMFLSGIGDISKHLLHLGYIVHHQQTALDEFDYSLSNLFLELRCGTRLVHITEILTQDKSLKARIRFPSVSRLQKIHNVNVALKALQAHGYDVETISAKNIVDGHVNQTLSLIWKLIVYFQIQPMLLPAEMQVEVKHLLELLKDLQKTSHHGGKEVVASIESRVGIESDVIELLKIWTQLICAYYNIFLADFSTSLSDGQCFCYIVHHYAPDLLPENLIEKQTTNGIFDVDQNLNDSFDTCSRQSRVLEERLSNERKNFSLLISKASKLGVPVFITATDMVNTLPDEKVNILFLAFLCFTFIKRKQCHATR